jgi:hypothetical protein
MNRAMFAYHDGFLVPGPMTKAIRFDSWEALLKSQGHDLRIEFPAPAAVRLDPDRIITVTLEACVAVFPRFRQRYFICPDPEQVLPSLSCPEPHRLRWNELISQQTMSYWRDFLSGPGSWLLTRLARFEHVVFWSDRGWTWPGVDDASYRPSGMQVPENGAAFFSSLSQTPLGPRQSAVRRNDFPDILAACILLVNYSGQDCWVADTEAREVYLVNNDEMVIVSIPERARREQLLRELDQPRSPLKNVSGFAGSVDDD